MTTPSESMTVLVVEDDETLREALVMCLESEGFKVASASGGDEAIEIVNKDESIGFVLSDVRMPKGDGASLLKNIRKNRPDLPVVCLLTGYSEHSKEQILKEGAIDLLSKPPDMEVIYNYIRKSQQSFK